MILEWRWRHEDCFVSLLGKLLSAAGSVHKLLIILDFAFQCVHADCGFWQNAKNLTLYLVILYFGVRLMSLQLAECHEQVCFLQLELGSWQCCDCCLMVVAYQIMDVQLISCSFAGSESVTECHYRNRLMCACWQPGSGNYMFRHSAVQEHCVKFFVVL